MNKFEKFMQKYQKTIKKYIYKIYMLITKKRNKSFKHFRF